ncbi:response regulator [Deinococcus radiotolerans]|uniref:Response regulatory domain-containing protein n=1 Tax=Deinococcus radiotolerans TaxID=1309407 RepID=A0ABQ2FFP4_9DEIO|nr:response regulator [Deinococcus radiotolerans]GGK93844.1 hypothetical protein GCM10010844_10480 [Deinococcus radiotolerans]
MEPFRLLLVDDQVEELLLVEAMLEGEVQTVNLIGVRSGAAALAYLDEAEQLPHLILLDLHLPGMSGLAVLAALRASRRLCNVNVVVRSGSNDPQDRQAATDAGASDYLIKPLSYAAQEDQMHHLLMDWQHLIRLTSSDAQPEQAQRH